MPPRDAHIRNPSASNNPAGSQALLHVGQPIALVVLRRASLDLSAPAILSHALLVELHDFVILVAIVAIALPPASHYHVSLFSILPMNFRNRKKISCELNLNKEEYVLAKKSFQSNILTN